MYVYIYIFSVFFSECPKKGGGGGGGTFYFQRISKIQGKTPPRGGAGRSTDPGKVGWIFILDDDGSEIPRPTTWCENPQIMG